MSCPLTTRTAGCCQWCDKPLTGRQKRWCSKTCARTAVREHRWTQARAAQMDAAAWYECAGCGYLFQRGDVQVNHKVPCLGKHGVWGCHHHSDNLEVLCTDCHLEVTATQRAAGLLKR